MATGADIVALARQQIGDPYIFGAEGPDSFDCSGLVEWVAGRLGLHTPRTTSQMIGRGSNLLPIGRGDLQAGDLIFSNWGEGRSSHVAIYTGAGTVVEAPKPGRTVTETPFGSSYQAHADAYRRIPGVSGGSIRNVGGVTGLAGGTSILSGALGALPFPNPGSVIEALTNIGQGMQNAAAAAADVGELAGTVGKIFLPSNAIRAFSLFFGIIFILIGVFFLAREVRQS